MNQINLRYTKAVHSKNLTAASQAHMESAEVQIVDTDVLGAMGLADKALETPRPGKRPAMPLAVPLARLFAGDNRAAHCVVRILAESAWKQARALRVPQFAHAESQDMAKACLAWHRDGVCRTCGGHGKSLIAGTKTHSERDCEPCRGGGKIQFEKQFEATRRELARWVVKQMTEAASYAGPEAMRFLAGKTNL